MNNMFENLLWLPQPSQDFAQQVTDAINGSDLKELAKFSLDESQLRRLYKKKLLLKTKKDDLLPLTDMTIGLISNATTNLVVPALVGSALRFGISLQVVEAEFNQIAQEAFSPDSSFLKQNFSTILVAIDYRGFPLKPCPGNKELARQNVQDCLAYVASVIEALRAKTGAQIILQNIALPVETLSGSYEGRLSGSLTWLISELNGKLDTLISDDTILLDISGLASNIGLTDWHDPTIWNMAKLPFSPRYLPIYSEYICRILAARLGKSRRCLILDLDNTLWGGVIGDDGIEGILIGNGDPTAEAYLHIQQTALNLRERGIVLAISSKNEESTALLPFKNHPDMLLREEHFAAFQANWSDKASNIRAISEMLSLGLESIVFLDDNPAERMQVRLELPEVAVPELPDDPALYVRTLIAAGYFEAITYSQEDSKRASFYQENIKRTRILSESSNLDEYLKSLDMEITFSEFDVTGRARIAQLISKSNQFNLTTKRYNEKDVKELEENPLFYTNQIRLKDTFGDNGMISVVICKKNLDTWEIDTWLMSCRVLSRKVELAVLQNILMEAKNQGVSKLIGVYSPTARNVIVKHHYEKLGFVKVSGESVIETWELNIANYVHQNIPMKLNNVI